MYLLKRRIKYLSSFLGETVAAINRSVTLRLERNLGLFAAGCTLAEYI
jgi:hypothetical protein